MRVSSAQNRTKPDHRLFFTVSDSFDRFITFSQNDTFSQKAGQQHLSTFSQKVTLRLPGAA